MSGNIYSFTIEQGVTFKRVISWKDEADNPIDMAGMTARMEIRSRDGVLLQEVTTEIESATGKITLSLTDEQTKALTFDTAVYDLEISQGGQVIHRLLKGVITLEHEATRDEAA